MLRQAYEISKKLEMENYLSKPQNVSIDVNALNDLDYTSELFYHILPATNLTDE